MKPFVTIELRGQVRSNQHIDDQICICPADDKSLPDGVQINHMCLTDCGSDLPGLQLSITNKSSLSKFINSNNILAHLEICTTDTDISHISLDGVVGPACEAHATVNWIPCLSLLDSGSQVTTLCRSFYNSHLKSSHQIQQLPDSAFKIEELVVSMCHMMVLLTSN